MFIIAASLLGLVEAVLKWLLDKGLVRFAKVIAQNHLESVLLVWRVIFEGSEFEIPVRVFGLAGWDVDLVSVEILFGLVQRVSEVVAEVLDVESASLLNLGLVVDFLAILFCYGTFFDGL